MTVLGLRFARFRRFPHLARAEACACSVERALAGPRPAAPPLRPISAK